MPVVKMTENMHPTMLKTVAVFFLDHPSLSDVEFNIGSKKPKAEVMPANNMARNSNGAKTLPIGPIMLKIIGKTMNINPVPSVIN